MADLDPEKRERRAAANRRYRARNRDAIRAREALKSDQRRATKRAYYLKNREVINEKTAQYYRDNRDHLLEAQRAYRQDPVNRERQKARAAAWYEQNGNKVRADVMARFHDGMRPEQWAAMWIEQDGNCYLCGEPMDAGEKNGRGPHIEHDHSCCGPRKSCSTCRRGLAHADCNAAIGYARDDPARLRRMADALEAAQKAFAERRASVPQQAELFAS